MRIQKIGLCCWMLLVFAFSGKGQLISESVDVLHYDIHLDATSASPFISGNTIVTLKFKQDSCHSIRLYLLHMQLDSILLNQIPVTTYSYNDTLLSIPLSHPYALSDTLSLHIYYRGVPQIDPSGWGGFYFQGNYIYNLGVGFQTLPHCFGRAWFPCIDEFPSKSYYDTYVTTPSTSKAICGGILMDSAVVGGGNLCWHWKLNSLIPSYLASVAVGNYSELSDTYQGLERNVPIQIFVPPALALKASASFIHLKQILQIFENKFGPYRWDRVGYVGVPFSGGAMEHVGNIAYPNDCITGDLTYESLYAHELSHHWFGDLITCQTAEDMWINEGWASFCEAVMYENLYSKDAYDAFIRDNHKTVLEKAHAEDGGYFPLYGIPSSITYGTTVYKKGADVIHTLRNYLGDSLFYGSLKNLMDSFTYRNIGTARLCNFLSNHTGINLTDFFNSWVYTSGFPHFAIDSTVSTGSGNNTYRVYLHQKLSYRSVFSQSNQLEISFISSNWQIHTQKVNFSGEYGDFLIQSPFPPALVILNMDQKVSDAVTADRLTLTATGNYSMPHAYFAMNVNQMSDSAFVRVSHHWVSPDPLKTTNSYIQRIHDRRYWKIEALLPQNFVATGRFNFNRGSDIQEQGLLPTTTSIDSLLMLYRRDAGDDWHQIPFSRVGSGSGIVLVDSIKPGEYTFGVGRMHLDEVWEGKQPNSGQLLIMPNPSKDGFDIRCDMLSSGNAQILNDKGNLLKSISLTSGINQFHWTPSHDSSGTYQILIFDKDQRKIRQQSAVFVK